MRARFPVSGASSSGSVGRVALGMTIAQEIIFALLTAVGAVAGSELIVRMWQFVDPLF
jgi:hypothetical protein